MTDEERSIFDETKDEVKHMTDVGLQQARISVPMLNTYGRTALEMFRLTIYKEMIDEELNLREYARRKLFHEG